MKKYTKADLTWMAIFMFVVGVSACYFIMTFVFNWKPLGRDNEAWTKMISVRNFVKEKYYDDVDDEKMLDGALYGMVSSIGDKYTRYFSKAEWEEVKAQITGTYVGIGVTILNKKNASKKVEGVKVISVMADSPAEKAGIQVGDRIVDVNGHPITAADGDMTVEIIKKSIGNIYVKVKRDGKYLKMKTGKEKVSKKAVTSKVLDDGVGLIRIDSFDEDVSKEFKDELDALSAKGIEGLLIDLRNNPGGSYDEVCKICDMLLGKCTIVYTEDKYKQRETRYSDEEMYDKPIVVMVNENSASASEVMTGALKDNNRAEIVGNTTYGKGLVQSTSNLNDGSGLLVTIARYFTPSGVCIHGKGIEPDYPVKDKKLQDRKALAVLKKAMEE